MDAGTSGPIDDERRVRARVRTLGLAIARPFTLASYRLIAAAVSGGLAGTAAQLLLPDWATAAELNAIVAVAAIGLAVLPFVRTPLRHGQEAFMEHVVLEREDWALWTGTKLPSGYARMERWLREHPDAPHGRVPVLAGLGRVEEALAELARRPPATADDAFERALVLEQVRLYTGEAPDLSALRRDLAALAEDRRRHRALCLATTEAMHAADVGGDPLAILAAARDPRGPSRLKARWFAAPAVLLVVALYPSILALPIRALLA